MTWDVIIVGFGPGGAALGWLMASRGLRTLVLERHHDFSREFRGEGVQPSGMEALRQMGLGDALARVPMTRPRNIQFWNGKVRSTLRVPVGIVDDVAIVSQPDLLEMFAAQSSAWPTFRLLRGASFTGLLRAGGRVVGVEARTEAGPERFYARQVLAMDGRFSAVARATEAARTALEQGFDVLWLRTPLPSLFPDEGSVWLEVCAQRMALAYPSPVGGAQVGLILRKGEAPPPQRGDLSWVISQVSPPLAAALAASPGPVHGPVRLNVVCSRLDRWAFPGLLLLGDAAHPMSPVGGQGINMALRDAVVAANHLVPLLRQGAEDATLDAAGAAIAAERLREVAGVQALQTKSGARLLNPPRLLLWAVPWLARLRIPFRPDPERARMQRGLVPVSVQI